MAQNANTKEWTEDIDYLVTRLKVQHPNLYANVSKSEFNKAADDLKARIPSLTDQQVVFGIHELMARIQDLHTGVASWISKDSRVKGYFDLYPVSFYHFSDGVFIKSVTEEHKDIVGCKVLKFGNLSTEETTKRILKLVNGDNYNGRLNLCDLLYMSAAGGLDYCGVKDAANQLTLTLQNSKGEIFNYTLKPRPFEEGVQLSLSSRDGTNRKGIVHLNRLSGHSLPLYLSRPGNAYWYQYIPEHKTLFVYLKEMEPKSRGDFDRFYKEVLKTFDETGAEKLVLDVRNNNGGDHFEMPLLKGVIARPKLDKPDKLFVIVGRTTGSASQHFATQFSMYTNATFIGENSGGRPNHYGAQRFFYLPNSNLPIRCSIIYHQDQTEWEMADCTRPDFYTLLSSSDFWNNADPALELIFNFDKVKNLKADFKRQLSTAYTNGGYDGLEKAYYQFMKNYEKTGVNKGDLINSFLFWLYPNKKCKEDYTRFLNLYAEECPAWSESWYALARHNELAGNFELAEKYYNKTLVVFPGNTIAKRRLELMLFKMKYDTN